MKFFLDTASLDEVEHATELGVLDGVIVGRPAAAKEGSDYLTRLAQIAERVQEVPAASQQGQVVISAEVSSTGRRAMVAEAESLAGIAPTLIPRIPATQPGFKACRDVSRRGGRVHMTLCYQPMQALAAAKAGAAVVGVFLGQFEEEDDSISTMLHKVRRMFNTYELKCELLAAGARHPWQLVEAALAGADIAAVTPPLLEAMLNDPRAGESVFRPLAEWSDTVDTFSLR